MTDPIARTRVRDLLQTSVEILGNRRAIVKAPLTSYFAALNVRSLSGPHCDRCDGPLLAEDPIVVDGTSRWHLACPPAW